MADWLLWGRNKMRLAFLTSIVPDGHPTTGFEIANDAILTGLRSLGHSVVGIGMALPRQDVSATPDTVVIDTFNLENASAGIGQKIRWILEAHRHGLPVAASKLRAVSASKMSRSVDEAGPFDLLLFNSYQMAAAFPALTQHPFIFIAHNVEHRTAIENARSAGSVLERYLYRRDARLLERIEADLCARAKHVWVLTEADRQALNLPESRSSVLPLVVPRRADPEEEVVKAFDFGMIGTWTWQANRFGLDWFLDAVVPLLPDNVSIAIGGAVPPGLRVSPNVVLLGRVDDAERFIRSVRIVPLVSRAGTGIQLKTIEAFQAGLPCVATSSALRGVADLPANCRSADDPAAFAQAMMEQLARERNGDLPNVDGQVFRDRQMTALTGNLKASLT